jgi:hypothetical protein
MTTPIILASSLLAVALVVALVREHRLRRAFQKLLAKLLNARSQQYAETPVSSTNVDTASTDPDSRL